MVKHLYIPSITECVKEHLIWQITERLNPAAFTEGEKKEQVIQPWKYAIFLLCTWKQIYVQLFCVYKAVSEQLVIKNINCSPTMQSFQIYQGNVFYLKNKII